MEYRGRMALFGIRPRDAKRLMRHTESSQESEILRLQARIETERLRTNALRAEVDRLEEASAIHAELWQRLEVQNAVQPFREQHNEPAKPSAPEQLFSLHRAAPLEDLPSRRGFTVVGGRGGAGWSPGRVGAEGTIPASDVRRERTVRATNAVKRRTEPTQTVRQPAVADTVRRYLEGKVVGSDLKRVDGRILAERGTPITHDIVEDATRHGVLAELILHMCYPEEVSE